MFPDTGKSFSRLNIWHRKQHYWHHWLMSGLSATTRCRPQRSAKLKISHWFYWSVYLAYQVFIFCQKHLKQSFCYTFYSLTTV